MVDVPYRFNVKISASGFIIVYNWFPEDNSKSSKQILIVVSIVKCTVLLPRDNMVLGSHDLLQEEVNSYLQKKTFCCYNHILRKVILFLAA